MYPKPSDEKIAERYLEYLSSRKFKPVLTRLAGTPWGHVIAALLTGATGVGAPLAVYHGWKMLNHRGRRREGLKAVARAARPIATHPIMYNRLLDKVPGAIAPALVIGSFRPRPGQDGEYWLDLMAKLMFLDPEQAETPEEKQALRWLNDERYVESGRMRLPTSLTGGFEVYAFQVMLIGDHFKNRVIDGADIPCMAVPGPVGAIQHIPWWIAEGAPAPA